MKLVTAITFLMNLFLEGGIPDEILPIFYGVLLCALIEPNDPVRPVAAGNTLRRLALKAALEPLVESLGELLRPVELGYGTKRRCEGKPNRQQGFPQN